MTFPLGSLRSAAADSSSGARASGAADSRGREARAGPAVPTAHLPDWPRQARLLLGGVAWLLLLIALVTHSPQDAAFIKAFLHDPAWMELYLGAGLLPNCVAGGIGG